MSLKFYQQLLQALKKGNIVLATVVNIQGSVPREIGAKMVICEDGEIFSTIGGGAGEAKVCDKAESVLKTGEKQWVTIDLSGAPHKTTEGVCGGVMQVWLEKWSGEEAIKLVEKIVDSLKLGQSIGLFTPFPPQISPYLLQDMETHPQPDSGFIEILQPPPALLIVGAGHVGIQLAKIGAMIGFQVLIQDDRTEWANLSYYPQAEQIFNHPITSVFSQLTHHHQLYIAMVTRGYKYDLDAIQAIVEHNINYQYLGMIGSKKRVNMVKKALSDLGFPKSKLNSIYAPIGLDIGALTPEEIAVSIGAELILVQRGGTGQPLSQPIMSN
ncbi:MAG: XdhC family protein [Microcystaceae cyanobacterium]